MSAVRVRAARGRVLGVAASATLAATPAWADFFDDVRRTFQTDIPRTFQHDLPRAFGAGDKPAPRPSPVPPGRGRSDPKVRR